ncbi:MAG: hypothetical protein ICV67_02005 [Thermoleophilia bacterium]|nr:hypothetical protein [Thermoleophilia bacterium]
MVAAVAVVSGLLLGGGAVGLVVPDAGPRTSEARARASLECGAVVHSLRGRAPTCERSLVRIDEHAALRLELPQGGEQPNDRRYPIVLRGEEGLLTSDSTRIPGLVAIADVAHGRLRVFPHPDPAAYLERLDERISQNAYARIRAFLLAGGILAALALVAPRAAVGGFVAVLAANLALGAAGVSAFWAVMLAVGLAGAVGGPLLARVPLVPLSAAVLAAYLGALAAEGTWVSLSPLGPTQNGRFFGLSNLLATLLLVPALVGASRRAAFLPVGVLSVVMVGGSSFGADGGGALVLVAGYAVLAVGLFPWRLAVPAVAAVAVAAALAIVVGPSTHVTAAGSSAPLDRIRLSLDRLADDWLVAAATAVALALLALLAWRGPRRPLSLALLAAVAVSMLVNDSPFEVAAAGLAGYLTLARYDSLR